MSEMYARPVFPPCQDGREDCSFEVGAAVTTLIAFTATYDRAGKPTTRDPNTITRNIRCLVCGRRWQTDQRAGELTSSVLLYSPPRL